MMMMTRYLRGTAFEVYFMNEQSIRLYSVSQKCMLHQHTGDVGLWHVAFGTDMSGDGVGAPALPALPGQPASAGATGKRNRYQIRLWTVPINRFMLNESINNMLLTLPHVQQLAVSGHLPPVA